MNRKPRAAISWSGGKDSCYAFELARKDYEIVAALTMMDEAGIRSRSHGIRGDLLREQTTAVGIAHVTRDCDWQSYERCFVDGLCSLKAEHDVSHLICGDIMYAEHRHWTEGAAAAAGLEAVEPLWGMPTLDVVQGFLETGGRALIVAVNARQLDSSWLGIELSPSCVAELIKRGVDPCGENGEYHTFVTNSPSFKRPLHVTAGDIVKVRGCWAIDLFNSGA